MAPDDAHRTTCIARYHPSRRANRAHRPTYRQAGCVWPRSGVTNQSLCILTVVMQLPAPGSRRGVGEQRLAKAPGCELAPCCSEGAPNKTEGPDVDSAPNAPTTNNIQCNASTSTTGDHNAGIRARNMSGREHNAHASDMLEGCTHEPSLALHHIRPGFGHMQRQRFPCLDTHSKRLGRSVARTTIPTITRNMCTCCHRRLRMPTL